MARDAEEILVLMDTDQAAETVLSDFNNPSSASIFQTFKKIFSQAANLLEQVIDAKKDETDAIIKNGIPATPAWLQAKALEFQYDATNPQVLSLVNYVPKYATVDEDLRVITRCAVVTDANRIAKVKVAAGTTAAPSPLNAAQAAAFDSYIDLITPFGIKYEIINLNADRVYVEGEIFYDGQYIGVIQENVEAAINDYLSNIDFNGDVNVNKLIDAIQNVEGVNDVRIDAIKCRAYATAFANATNIYSLSASANARKWSTVAGYVVEEDTGGETFADKITYTVY